MVKTHYFEETKLKESIEKSFEQQRKRLTDDLEDASLKYDVQQQKLEKLEHNKMKAESESNALSVAYETYKIDQNEFQKTKEFEVKELKTREVSLRFRTMSLGKKLRTAEKLISKKTHELKAHRKDIKALKKKVENGKKLRKRLRQKVDRLQSEIKKNNHHKYLPCPDERHKYSACPFKDSRMENFSKSTQETKETGQQTEMVEDPQMLKLCHLENVLFEKEISLNLTKKKLDVAEGQNEGYKGLLQNLGFFSRKPDPFLLQEVIGQSYSSTGHPFNVVRKTKSTDVNYKSSSVDTNYILMTSCRPSSMPQTNEEMNISTKSLIPPIHPRPLSSSNLSKNGMKAPKQLFGIGSQKYDSKKLPLLICTKCDNHIENIFLKSVSMK